MPSRRSDFVRVWLLRLTSAMGRAWGARRLQDTLLVERERWPLWIPVFLGIGIAGYFSQASEPPGWLGPAGVLSALGFAWVFRNEPRGFLTSIGIALAAAGFGLAQIRTHWVSAPILAEPVRSAQISGRVKSIETHARGVRIVLDEVAIEGRRERTTPKRIRITLYRSGDFRPGDHVSMRATLNPPPRPALPRAFDFGRQAFFQGFGAVGFSTSRVQVLSRTYPTFPHNIRQQISALRLEWARAVLGRLQRRVAASQSPC